MSSSLEYRDRERQRKRESRRQASQAQWERERQRARERRCNFTDEQQERGQERNRERRQNFAVEQRERDRERRRNLTDEQHEREQERNRERRQNCSDEQRGKGQERERERRQNVTRVTGEWMRESKKIDGELAACGEERSEKQQSKKGVDWTKTNGKEKVSVGYLQILACFLPRLAYCEYVLDARHCGFCEITFLQKAYRGTSVVPLFG